MMSGVGVPVGSCFVEYRPIPGFSLYLLGSDRSVWSCSTGVWRRRKLTFSKAGGAAHVTLIGDDGKPAGRSLNRLMREVFPPVDADEETDVRPAPWASFGADNGRAVLTRDQVEEARLLKARGWAFRDLVKRYGCSRSNLWHVLKGRTWAAPDLPDPAPADEAPAPVAPAPPKRRGRKLERRHAALRARPTDATPLDQLEMPRPKAPPAAPVPLDEQEARRLHAEGATVRELVARYGVRPIVIVATLKGE